MIDEILKSNINYNKRGSNSKCFCFDKYAFLYGSINIANEDKLINTLASYKKRGFNLCQIYEYKLDPSKKLSDYGDDEKYQDGWTLEERASGKELYMRRNSSFRGTNSFEDDYKEYKDILDEYISIVEEYSNIPVEHLEKFISDYITLQEENKLFVDPSKASNFFYDKDKGFTFIDLLISNNARNEYLSPTWSAIYAASQIFPNTGYVGIRDESVRNGASDLISFPLTEEEFNKIKECQSILYNKVINILKDKDIDMSLFDERINGRLISENSYITTFNNEEERKTFLREKMVLIESDSKNKEKQKNEDEQDKIVIFT